MKINRIVKLYEEINNREKLNKILRIILYLPFTVKLPKF